MKAIIFGSKGQDGYYLTKLLEKQDVEVIGFDVSKEDCINGCVSDFEFVEGVIKKHRPDYIFHFAAISSTGHDFLFDNHKIISTGTLNILEGALLHCPQTRIFLSGSAMQFKNLGKPIGEKTPFEASSPYAIARIQSVYAGRYYKNKFGMKVYIGYFFNHDSPLRTEQHLNKKISEAVKRIYKGSLEKITIGDMDAKKEFNFAGDIVEAIWLLINQDNIFEAIIGSGKAYSIKQYIDYCFKKINMNWKDHVVINRSFVSEYKVLVSNPKVIKSLGWSPKIGFKKIIDIMMETF